MKDEEPMKMNYPLIVVEDQTETSKGSRWQTAGRYAAIGTASVAVTTALVGGGLWLRRRFTH